MKCAIKPCFPDTQANTQANTQAITQADTSGQSWRPAAGMISATEGTASVPTRGATSAQSINPGGALSAAASASTPNRAPERPMTGARERLNDEVSTSAAAHPTPAVVTASGRRDRRVTKGQNVNACCLPFKSAAMQTEAYTLLRSPNVHFISVARAK